MPGKTDEGPRPFATLVIKYYDMTTFGVESTGESTKITTRLLERSMVSAQQYINTKRRQAFQQSVTLTPAEPTHTEEAEAVNG